MDLINRTLSLTPLPYLDPALSAFKFIWSDVEQVEVSQRQLEALAQSIAQLLLILDTECRAGREVQVGPSTPLANLSRLLDDICTFVQKVASSPFLKLLFTKDQRNTRMEGYHRSLIRLAESFQISPLLDTRAWQAKNDEAQTADQQALNDRLHKLENNRQWLKDALNTPESSMMAMIVSLQRRLDNRSDGNRERQFFSHVLRYLTRSSGIRVELQNWMITSYDVEFGQKIGCGGFGQVFLGTWNNAQVAIKVLVTEAGIIPSSTAIRQEIETWSMLRHTHILQFLAANEFDDRPFIVMPYMTNGNARDYVRGHPECNRLQILHHVSLGLVYLHSHKIVHGDLKAVNILIDHSGKALLCDFGLSRIKADVTSRTVVKPGGGIIAGSRNWMAPELLLVGSLKKPCDIYAFGMTIYEIFADEVPLGHVNPADLLNLVVERNVRPERPDDEDAPYLSDAIWEVAEHCWVKDSKSRPTASALCDTFSHLLDTTVNTPSLTPGCPASNPSFITMTVPSPTTPRLPVELSPDQRLTAHATSNTLYFTSVTQPMAAPHTSHPVVPPLSIHYASVNPDPDRPSSTLPNLTLRGHTSHVICATFSPDGKYIVSGSRDNTIMLWNAWTGNLVLGPLKEHTSIVRCAAFSPDSGRIASGSSDNTLLVWNAITGKIVAGPFSGHTSWIHSVSFSPDGEQIVSGSSDNTIRVWNAWTGDLLIGPLIGHTDWVRSVTFSRDGTRLISGSDDRTVRVWNVESGQLIHSLLQRHQNWMCFVAFSSCEDRIVCADTSGDVCVWDTNTGTLVSGPSKQHGEGTLTLEFSSSSTDYCAVSPDGKWIAARSRDIVQVWDSKTGCLVATISNHTGYVCSVSFSPDSKQILSSSQDKSVYIHTILGSDKDPQLSKSHLLNNMLPETTPSSSVLPTLTSPPHVPIEPGPDHRPTTSALHEIHSHVPDTTATTQPLSFPARTSQIGLPVPVLHTPTQPCPDPLTPSPHLTLGGHTDTIYCAVFSPDGKYIVSGSLDSMLMLWDAQTGNVAWGPLQTHTNVCCVAFSPDGRQTISGSWDQSILLWDVVTRKMIAGPLKGHTNMIYSVCFSPDGQHIASGSWDKTIQVWDAETGDLLVDPLTGHTGSVYSVSFSGDGRRLVSGSSDKTVRIWNASSGQLIGRPLKGHTTSVQFVAFSPHGERIVSAQYGGDVCVWDTDMGTLVSGPSKQHAEGTLTVVFTSSSTNYCAVSPDGKWIAWCNGGDQMTVEIYDSKTSQLVVTFSDHTDRVYSISFSPDSKQVLSASADKTICVHTLI